MTNIFFLVLRRMRMPLIVLVSVYSVATLGMTLIPGVTPSGDAWRMTFFQAFYFVSFMGTTIGFGEIPHEFTQLQRSWVLVCIYTSVIAWLYGIGSLLRLVQDESFLHAVSWRNFQQSIKKIDTPFYIICGYGETGEMINHGLTDLGIQTVILDVEKERISSLELGNFLVSPIAVTADITDPDNLVKAGINHAFCKGLIAVTNHDHINLQVAVAGKLVNNKIKLISRSEIEDEAKNMASFGTDLIINPYLVFARRLRMLITTPGLFQIQHWFINQYANEGITQDLTENGLPAGNWVICGYGRFGKAIHEAIGDVVDNVTIVTPDPISDRAPDNSIVGRGTEADTLLEANLRSADVIVAASEDDANNLSIVMTAKQLNSEIITIARSSKEANKTLFNHANCHYTLRRSLVVANEVLTYISRPLVTKFIRFSGSLSENEVSQLLNEIDRLTGLKEPITWRLVITPESSPELVDFLSNGVVTTLGQISESNRVNHSRCLPLLLLRDGISTVLPSLDEQIEIGDQILFCGPKGSTLLPQHLQHNTELLDTLINNNKHYIPLLRWLQRKQ
ncbi:MAG: NAD-binding protein [Gammaproteobacteria bacterium]|nr:NAD-binding protein [Gammaproteobacteria bacterium]